MSMTPEQFAELLKTAEGRLVRETGKALTKIAIETINKAQRNFTGDDLPRVARTRNTKRGNKGSAYRRQIKSGNSGYRVGPRAITGNLRRSLNLKFSFNEPDGLQAHVMAGFGKAIEYAAPLEYGAPARNILPRMYIGRAVEDVQKDKANEELFKALNISITGRSDG